MHETAASKSDFESLNDTVADLGCHFSDLEASSTVLCSASSRSILPSSLARSVSRSVHAQLHSYTHSHLLFSP